MLMLSVFLSACQSGYSEPVRIGVESRVEDSQRSHYNRYVNWRPANSETVHLDDRKGLNGHVNPITGEDYREYYEGNILCGHNLWISNKDKASQWRFLTVIYPQPPGGQIPAIKALDDFLVQVGSDVICFDPKSELAPKADFVIDLAAFRE